MPFLNPPDTNMQIFETSIKLFYLQRKIANLKTLYSKSIFDKVLQQTFLTV